MEDDSKFGQFKTAFESGQQGQVSNYEMWLESHGFDPNRVDEQVIRDHLRQHPEKTVDYDEQLQEVGEFAGHFAATGGTVHLPVTGVSGAGKTQFKLTVESALEHVEADFEIQSHACGDLADEIEVGESDPSVETYTEFRLDEVSREVNGVENAVFVLDDCGEDKRVSASMTSLESSVENALFITLWTPEAWGRWRADIEAEIPTAKQIKLSGLTKTECNRLASTVVEFIGGDSAPPTDAVEIAFDSSRGVPGLFTSVLLESLKQAFLEDREPWDPESISDAVDQLGITDATEQIESLSQAKLRLIRDMLINGDKRGIRPKRLVESLGIDKSTVSYHLNDLSSDGLVDSVKEGRSAQYSVGKFIKPLAQMRLEKEVEINV